MATGMISNAVEQLVLTDRDLPARLRDEKVQRRKCEEWGWNGLTRID